MERVFKSLYFAGMVAEILLRVPYERKRNAILKTDRRITGAERGILAALSLSMFLLPAVYTLTRWLDFADYPLSPRNKTRVGGIGAMLMTGTLWLFWRSHHDLGTNWSPSLEIGERHTLVVEGVYRSIRHPMYASGWLWGLSQACLLQNWIAGVSGLVAFLAFYVIRVPREERMMLDHFGDDYRVYCERTGRVVPSFCR